MDHRTDTGAFLRMLSEAQEAAGIDSEAVYRRIGIRPEALQDSSLRTPHDMQAEYWEAVAAVSGDPDIGLLLGQHMPPYQGQVIDYLFLSSETFGDGLERALRYQRLISDAIDSRLHVDGDTASLSFGFPNDDPEHMRHSHHCMALGMVTFFRSLTSQNFSATKAHLRHSAPSNIDRHEQAFGCPLEFGCPDNRLFFDAALLNTASPRAQPELLQVHEQVADAHLLQLQRQDIVHKVRDAISEVLETGEANLDTIAGRLELKPRALRSRLMAAGTNFNQVLDDLRRDLAKQLLARTHESIDHIVYVTGFSEPSTFYRAFRRWAGMTPVEYRNHKREAAAANAALAEQRQPQG